MHFYKELLCFGKSQPGRSDTVVYRKRACYVCVRAATGWSQRAFRRECWFYTESCRRVESLFTRASMCRHVGSAPSCFSCVIVWLQDNRYKNHMIECNFLYLFFLLPPAYPYSYLIFQPTSSFSIDGGLHKDKVSKGTACRSAISPAIRAGNDRPTVDDLDVSSRGDTMKHCILLRHKHGTENRWLVSFLWADWWRMEWFLNPLDLSRMSIW